MRRLLHVAMTRARAAARARVPARAPTAARAAAVAVRRGGARGARRGVGGRARRSCSAPTSRCTRRTGCCATSCWRRRSARRAARRAALRHRPRRHARRRALPGDREARGADRAAARASRSPRRCRGQRSASRSAITPLQREVLADARRSTTSSLDAERDDRAARRGDRARAHEPSLEAFLPRRGEGLVLSARRTSRPTGRARCSYKFARVFRIPQEPTLQPALRHPRPPGPRALPPDGGSDARRAARAARGRLAARRLRRPRGGAPAARARRRTRCAATTSASRPSTSSRSGSSAASRSAWAAHAARARRPRRPPAEGGWELIDYKTGRPRSVAAAARGRAAVALRDRRARGVGPRVRRAGLPLRARRREGPRPDEEIDPDWIDGDRPRGRRRHPGQGFEPTPSYAACAMLRLPHRLPRSGTMKGRLSAAPRRC